MKTNNRAWVKNAAIIFLAVLLVLTFFSNTILNRSLPEVSGQNSYGGEISTAVRGSGTVAANEAYSIEIDTSREINKIHVKVGDTVEAGQLMFSLEPTDSAELKAAIKSLEELQYAYNVKLLSASTSEYELITLRETLEDAIEKQNKSVTAQADLKAAEARDDAAQLALQKAKDEISEIEAEIARLTEQINSGIDEDLMTEEMKAKKLAVEHAQENYDDALKEYNTALAGGSVSDLTSYVNAVNTAAEQVGIELSVAANTMYVKYSKDENQDGGGYLLYQHYNEEASKGTAADPAEVNSRLETLLRHSDNAGEPEVKSWIAAVTKYNNAVSDLNAMSAGSSNVADLKAYLDSCERELSRAKNAWEEATKDIRVEGKEEREVFRAKLKTKQTALIPIQKEATSATEALTKAKADAAFTPEDAAAAIKTAQRALEKKITELDNSEALRDLELERDRKVIAEQQKTISDLREKETGTEITTRYGGTVLSIDTMVGDLTKPGQILATIEINGKGYTIEFSVTNEETQRVRIGDVATISSWGMSNTTCTLVAIKTDRDNPTRRKILEFDVTGDSVTAGQNLEFSVGTRTQYYNNVVPNSAIREDADGKFVLIASAKSTPLGTRYIATRIDVEVLNSDTKNSAISGDFSWAPYIITTSSKPIEPNTQVRLVG